MVFFLSNDAALLADISDISEHTDNVLEFDTKERFEDTLLRIEFCECVDEWRDEEMDTRCAPPANFFSLIICDFNVFGGV
jgi:hypothetical protein